MESSAGQNKVAVDSRSREEEIAGSRPDRQLEKSLWSSKVEGILTGIHNRDAAKFGMTLNTLPS